MISTSLWPLATGRVAYAPTRTTFISSFSSPAMKLGTTGGSGTPLTSGTGTRIRDLSPCLTQPRSRVSCRPFGWLPGRRVRTRRVCGALR